MDGQRGLEYHSVRPVRRLFADHERQDGSHLSYNILLSAPDQFTGGGTEFQAI